MIVVLLTQFVPFMWQVMFPVRPETPEVISRKQHQVLCYYMKYLALGGGDMLFDSAVAWMTAKAPIAR